MIAQTTPGEVSKCDIKYPFRIYLFKILQVFQHLVYLVQMLFAIKKIMAPSMAKTRLILSSSKSSNFLRMLNCFAGDILDELTRCLWSCHIKFWYPYFLFLIFLINPRSAFLENAAAAWINKDLAKPFSKLYSPTTPRLTLPLFHLGQTGLTVQDTQIINRKYIINSIIDRFPAVLSFAFKFIMKHGFKRWVAMEVRIHSVGIFGL